jgi:predicted permease
VKREIDEELDGYLESAVEEKMRRGQGWGMTRDQALRAARAELGSPAAVKDKMHETGWESLVEAAWQDLRFAFRMMRKNPAFTLVAVLTLAVGIGATTTVYGWIDTVLVHPLPGVERPGEIVAIESLTPGGQPTTTSYPDIIDFRDHLQLVRVAAARHTAVSVGEPENSQQVAAQFVSGNYFDVLGVKPELGRVFAPEEYGDAAGAFPVAVISDRLWRARFNSDAQIAGKTIKVNRHELTIVGVVPAEFPGSTPGLTFDVWVPNVMRPLLNGFHTDWQIKDRHNRDMLAFARLKPGVTVEQARAEIAALAGHLAEIHADTNLGIGATLLPVWKSHFGFQSVLLAPLAVLMAVCLVVLLIVCANVGNLLLAHFAARQKEFSMRLALGARRGRLVRQVLTESLVLAAAGATLGVAFAFWAGGLLRLVISPRDYRVALDFHLNQSVLAFVGLLCIATTLLSGLAPALQSIRVNLSDSLKDFGRGAAGQHSHRTRKLLVLSEVSLASVTLILAGLFVRSFRAAQKIDAGFDPQNVLLAQFFLSTSGYNLEQREQFCFRLRENLEAQPDIVAVTYSDGVPLGFEPSWWEELQIKGYQPRPSENMAIYRNVVAPGYFQLMHIPLLEGRDFTERDNDEKGTQPVMIVNQAFVKRFFGTGTGAVIGRQVHGWGAWFTIVGVVKDSKYNYRTEAPMPYFYVPFRQVYRADMALAFYLKTRGDPNQAVATLRRVVRETDANVTITKALPLADYIGASLNTRKIAASMLTGLGILALVLAAVGLYSVMAYSVTQRTHEIGVRMALGAQRGNVLGIVLRQGMGLALAGVVVGTVIGLALARKVAGINVAGSTMNGGGSLLVGSATDPLIYLGAALFLCAVAALANYVPARRAIKVDPVVALRAE